MRENTDQKNSEYGRFSGSVPSSKILWNLGLDSAFNYVLGGMIQLILTKLFNKSQV